ncbi:MAG: hypothetical protein WBH08_06335 [Methanothrix sp.]|uniref:hypothetical protein n=1 Tax=Methanothrix sp. TaxID=90426 RepID=UPI0027B4F997|nr:hypothetical protein [Euryarchaeota archaeon]
MKIVYYLTALLILSSMALPAACQDGISLTVNVHEEALDGPLLSEVLITGLDGIGNEFAGVTDSDGVAVISGTPGAWQFAFQKNGYDDLNLQYNATQTEETAAYLEKSSEADQVALAVYVHEGSLDGPILSDVQITGQDGDGNDFAGITNSSGVAIISGIPGSWQFAFQKDGYDALYLEYNATQSEEAAAYLEKAA